MSHRAPIGALTTTWPQPGRALLLVAVDGIMLQSDLAADSINDLERLQKELDRMRMQLLRAIARGRGRRRPQ